MTEHIQGQLSAFIDDELSDEECAFLVRRLERDEVARAQLSRYALIGAALRNELLQPHPWVLQQRIHAALDGVAVAQPAPRASRAAPFRRGVVRPVVGAGIAATVAVAALGLLRYSSQGESDRSEPAVATAGTAGARSWTEPESYVVPQEASPETVRRLPIRLTNYMLHHGEYAAPLNRTSVRSNLVGVAVNGELVLFEQAAVEEPLQ